MQVTSWAFLMFPDLGYLTFPHESFRIQSSLIVSVNEIIWALAGTSGTVGTPTQYLGEELGFISTLGVTQIGQESSWVYDVSHFEFAKLQ